MGWTLGGEVLKVHSSIYTESVKGPRTFFSSLAKASLYPRVKIEKEPEYSIDVVEEEIELPLTPFPSETQALEILRKWEAEVERLKDGKALAAGRNVARRYRHWARVLYQNVSEGREQALRATVQGIRIGDFAIVAFPGETFTETGLEVKKRAPFNNTLFLGYSNGCLCYIPTCDAYPKEGWSVHKRYHIPDMIPQAYAVPTIIKPEVEEMIVHKSLQVLETLKQRATTQKSAAPSILP